MADVSPVLIAEQSFSPGEGVVIEGPSHCSPFAVVFEDDGETAYFYGLDTRKHDEPILDALHIYDVEDVVDRDRSSTAQIVWSASGLQALLLINDHPHAAFDFAMRRGYSRTGFPPPSPNFSRDGHEWSDEILQLFRGK